MSNMRSYSTGIILQCSLKFIGVISCLWIFCEEVYMRLRTHRSPGDSFSISLTLRCGGSFIGKSPEKAYDYFNYVVVIIRV